MNNRQKNDKDETLDGIQKSFILSRYSPMDKNVGKLHTHLYIYISLKTV